VGVGFDDGVVVLQLGQDDPSYSMDPLTNSCPHSANNARTWVNGDVRQCHRTLQWGSLLSLEKESISFILLSRARVEEQGV